MLPFVGRRKELGELLQLSKRNIASLVVIKGRRRIGKSRLVQQFAEKSHARFYSFAGSAPVPDKTTAQDQRVNFAEQYAAQFGSTLPADNWYAMLVTLAERVNKGRTIILLDEISWMANGDHNFLGKLKTVWDSYFSKNPDLILVLCGSISMWIEKNILSNTAFVGRINLNLTLGELSLAESNALLKTRNFNVAPMGKFMVLAVTGGIPWYIEQIDGSLSASENIQRLCFSPNGILVTEFSTIFNDLFKNGRREICRKIVEYLASGPAEQADIARHLNYEQSGALSSYLKDLIEAGFVSRDNDWDFVSGKIGKLSRYRLRDNYLRFYLKYIEPQKEKIEKGKYEAMSSITSLPGWDGIMGLQFENLVVNNHQQLLKQLHLRPEEMEFHNPYFQHTTARQPGCQIDYLIQSKFHDLYVCEIKFAQRPLGTAVIKEVEKKIKALKRPRNFACIPVLIQVGDTAQAVMDKDFFWQIVNFADLLEESEF